MNTLEFISKIIEAIAWPLSIVVLAFLLRNPIKSLIPLLSKLKYGDVELEFGKDVTKLSEKVNLELFDIKSKDETLALRDRAMSLLKVSPKAAVIEVWRAVETVILEICTRNKLELDRELLKKPIKIAELLMKEKLIDEMQYNSPRPNE